MPKPIREFRKYRNELKAARIELDSRKRSELQSTLSYKSTVELLEIYDEAVTQLNLRFFRFSEKYRSSKRIVDVLDDLLKRRSVTEEKKRLFRLNAYNERMKIENLKREIQQEEGQKRELESLRAELESLLQAEAKRKIRVGVGIGFWF